MVIFIVIIIIVIYLLIFFFGRGEEGLGKGGCFYPIVKPVLGLNYVRLLIVILSLALK